MFKLLMLMLMLMFVVAVEAPTTAVGKAATLDRAARARDAKAYDDLVIMVVNVVASVK